jgi:hypothetical protein
MAKRTHFFWKGKLALGFGDGIESPENAEIDHFYIRSVVYSNTVSVPIVRLTML